MKAKKLSTKILALALALTMIAGLTSIALIGSADGGGGQMTRLPPG